MILIVRRMWVEVGGVVGRAGGGGGGGGGGATEAYNIYRCPCMQIVQYTLR